MGLLTLAVLAWIVGQVVRDRFWWSGLCFYLPSPVLAVILLISCGLQVKRQQWRALVFSSLGLVIVASVVLAFENQWARVSRDGSDPELTAGNGEITDEDGQRPLRIVHWNVCWGAMGWEKIRTELLAQNADLYVISELSSEATAADFPGWHFVRWGTITVVSKTRYQLLENLSSGRVQAYLMRWDSPAGSIRMLVADSPANVSVHRDPLMTYLTETLEQTAADFLIGDLNAPRRSRALADLPTGYRHGYDSAGCGWSYTWPVPCPVFAIDHCIHGPRIIPLRYDLRTTSLSDHRMQRLEFRLAVPPRPGGD